MDLLLWAVIALVAAGAAAAFHYQGVGRGAAIAAKVLLGILAVIFFVLLVLMLLRQGAGSA